MFRDGSGVFSVPKGFKQKKKKEKKEVMQHIGKEVPLLTFLERLF